MKKKKKPAAKPVFKKPAKKPAAKSSFSAVALSKAGKVLKRPKGKDVYYGIAEKRGKKTTVRRIESDDAQKFSKKDLKALDVAVKEGGGKLVWYEERTRKIKKDKKGNTLYKIQTIKGKTKFKLDKAGRKMPKRETKLTFGKTDRKQRPVLFDKGKRIRELDLGFRKRKKREVIDNRLLVVLPFSTSKRVFKRTVELNKSTIHESLRHATSGVTMKQLKRQGYTGLYAKGQIIIREKGKPDRVLREVETRSTVVSNLSRYLAYAVRQQLALNNMYFTQSVDLESMMEEDEEEGRVPKDLYMQAHLRIFPEYLQNARENARVFVQFSIHGYPPK